MSSFASSFTAGITSLDENRQDPPKPEVVVRMLVENIREVAYSVKKHRGGHNSVPGFVGKNRLDLSIHSNIF
jgi:hypothetical protein